MPDHPLFAAVYDRLMAASEAGGLATRRRQLLAQARGRVLELGAGIGLNLSHYRPERVSSLVALEPDGAMRRRLLARGASAGLPLEVHDAGVDEVAFPAATFDTIVATLVLCTVPDLDQAAQAVGRWLKPTGRLLFLEHVRAVGLRGALQRAAAPVWAVAAGGCRLDRDTLGALRRAGWAITDCERFAMPAGGVLLSSCVQGVGRRHPVGSDDGEDDGGSDDKGSGDRRPHDDREGAR